MEASNDWKTDLNDIRQKFITKINNEPKFSAERACTLIKQINSLLDENEWYEKDVIPTEDSLTTLVNLLIATDWIARPGLGITNTGDVVAMYTSAEYRLTIECGTNNTYTWVRQKLKIIDSGKGVISHNSFLLDLIKEVTEGN